MVEKQMLMTQLYTNDDNMTAITPLLDYQQMIPTKNKQYVIKDKGHTVSYGIGKYVVDTSTIRTLDYNNIDVFKTQLQTTEYYPLTVLCDSQGYMYSVIPDGTFATEDYVKTSIENIISDDDIGYATIKYVDDAIAAVATSCGGGVSYNRLDSWADYTSDKAGYVLSALLGYDLNTRLSSVEGDYATKDFVNNKLTSCATTDSVTAIQNTLTGQIDAVGARVDSNDEQIAILNETTSGYTTSISTLTQRVDSVEQLAATKLDSSYFTQTNIKSTLGISDWALASAKPTYTASEVGALSVSDIPTKLSQLTDDVVAGRYLPLSGGTLNGSITATSFIGNLTGNADSATKLAARSKLWVNDFDGTEDVSGNLYSDICKIVKDSTWNGTFIQSANYDGTSDSGNIYMSAMGGNKLTSFNVWANDSKFSNNVTVAGNVGIGTTSPTERLDVSGNIKASGNINATSITINGVTITASNGSITVNGNVIATGSITAKKSA